MEFLSCSSKGGGVNDLGGIVQGVNVLPPKTARALDNTEYVADIISPYDESISVFA